LRFGYGGETKEEKNGNVNREARRARVQAVDSGARPATACGLRDQAAGDARRTRGRRVLNLSNTVAAIQSYRSSLTARIDRA